MDKEKTISIHSTTRVETMVHGFSMLQRLISIHSTTRVETEDRRNVNRECWISIHSTTRVETPSFKMSGMPVWNFNPLHHEGGDHRCPGKQPRAGYFNPLHHEGGDSLREYLVPNGYPISIHSTTRVETIPCSPYPPALRFQSTPPRGWRLIPETGLQVPGYFNPLHHEGGDASSCEASSGSTNFNPLHHEGGDE